MLTSAQFLQLRLYCMLCYLCLNLVSSYHDLNFGNRKNLTKQNINHQKIPWKSKLMQTRHTFMQENSQHQVIFRAHRDPHRVNGDSNYPLESTMFLSPTNNSQLPIIFIELKQNSDFVSRSYKVWESPREPSPLQVPIDGSYFSDTHMDAANLLGCYYNGTVYAVDDTGNDRHLVWNKRYVIRPMGRLVGDTCTAGQRLFAMVDMFDDYWFLEPLHTKAEGQADQLYVIRSALEHSPSPSSFGELLSSVSTNLLKGNDTRIHEIHKFLKSQNPELDSNPSDLSPGSEMADEVFGAKDETHQTPFLRKVIIKPALDYHIDGDQLNPINYPVYLDYLNAKHNTTSFGDTFDTTFLKRENLPDELKKISFGQLRLGKAGVFCGDNKYQNNQITNIPVSSQNTRKSSKTDENNLEISINIFADEKMVTYIIAEIKKIQNVAETIDVAQFLIRVLQQVDFVFNGGFLPVKLVLRNLFILYTEPESTREIYDIAYLLEKANLFQKKVLKDSGINTFSWLTGKDVYTRFYFIQDYNTKAFAFYGNTLYDSTITGHVAEGTNGISTIRSIVHSLGHNLNLHHDEGNESRSGLMSPFSTNSYLKWSNKSIISLEALIRSKNNL